MNIKEINEIYFRLGADYKRKIGHPISHYVGRSYCYGILTFIYQLLISPFKFGLRLPEVEVSIKTLYFGTTINNARVLEKVYSKDQNTKLFLCDKSNIPIWKQFVYSILKFPSIVRFLGTLNSEEREIVKVNFLTFLCTPGIYHVTEEIIKKYNPEIVVLANDHSTYNRCMLDICNHHDIKTIYIQHASVTEAFPHLNFSYSFLDGMESYLKYDVHSANFGKIYIVGGVRFDNLEKINRKGLQTIGIALNEFDDLRLVNSLVEELNKLVKAKIIVRPHPSRASESFGKWCKMNHLEYSDSSKQSSFQFLSEIDLLFANDSSIHLDAAIIGCPSYVFNMSKEGTRDYYGYIKNGLVREINLETLYDGIKSFEKVSPDIIKYYYAAYNTQYAGQVSSLIIDLINVVLNNEDIEKFEKNHNLEKVPELKSGDIYMLQ